MRGVASIRTETHLRRFLHGIRLFCNAHSPPKALSHQSTPHFFKAPYGRWQYGLLSPYFATLNTGSCRPISLRSIRALATLLPLSGGNTLRRSGYVLGLRPCAHTPTQLALLPLAIRALVALFRCAQYGLLSPYFATLNTGSCRPISLRSIRALATLLPRVGGNTLRRSGYVLPAPRLARIRLRNSPYCPWQYGPK